MSDWSIRWTTRRDTPVLYQLMLELAEYEKLLETVKLSEEALGEALYGSRPLMEAILAERLGIPIGFAFFYPVFPTFLGKPGMYLEDIFVRPSQRGQGVGKALLATVGRIAHERGYGRVDWAVLDWNESALSFYRSLGAKPKTGWTVYQLGAEALEEVSKIGLDPKPATE